MQHSNSEPVSAPLFDLPYPLPVFTAIEYPGSVSTSAASVENALDAIGGLQQLSRTLATEDVHKRVVELQLGDSKSGHIDGLHPVHGDIVPTQNILLKIVKKRKKRKAPNEPLGEASVVLPGWTDNKGYYTAQVVGVIDKTVRFRCLLLCFVSGQYRLIVMMCSHGRFPVRTRSNRSNPTILRLLTQNG